MHPTITAWVEADRGLDLSAMAGCLAPDAVLISPLTDAFAFNGADEVIKVFESAFELLRDIEIHAVTGANNDWVVHGTNTLNGHNLEEIQWLHLNDDGLIDRVTLFIRPLPAALDLLAQIGVPMAKRGLFDRKGAIASTAARPLAAALRAVEAIVMPQLRKISPRRG
ncbi:MAG: nuclear transport factor 2 family protein [Propionibacteriaceae bacterium]|nr:nuclear transport factor 2 family protein [Propionibacteriaceae bacterium]